jgi:large subunit ribosomal protein L10
MPLTKAKKVEVVTDVSDLLKGSKLTVVAKYQGTSVKDMQSLRRQARENGTQVKVVKNRLVIQALKNIEQFKDIDTTELEGMLAYAFNKEDEVAPAQTIAQFAKSKPTMEFVGGISAEGKWLNAEKIKTLSELPSKSVLIASVISLLGSPVRSVVSAASGQLPAILSALQAKAN